MLEGLRDLGNRNNQMEDIPWENWLPTPKGTGTSIAVFRLLYGLQVIEASVLRLDSRKKENIAAVSGQNRDEIVLKKDTTSGTHDIVIVKEKIVERGQDTVNPRTQVESQGRERQQTFIVIDEDDERNSEGKNSTIAAPLADNCATNDSVDTTTSKTQGDNDVGWRFLDSESGNSAKAWRECFINLGGLQHLIHVLKSIDLSNLSDAVADNQGGPPIDSSDISIEGDSPNGNSVLMACASKLVFLLRILAPHVLESNHKSIRRFQIHQLVAAWRKDCML